MTDFNGKKVLVVGGNSGIGQEIVDQLKAQGAHVFTASRNPSGESGSIKLDVQEDFKQIEGIPDQLDGLVYCPGSINLKPFQSLKPADFMEDFQINVLGAVKVIQAVLKNLRKSDSASVVLFSTVAVSQGMNYHASVASAKGAIEGLVRSLAAEFASKRIRFNAIAPSLTDTPMAGNLLSTEDKRKASEERHPLKKIGSPKEIAAAAVFLLSDNASWTTGQVLNIDGGMSSVRPL